MVMYSAHATTHANRSKKNTFSRRTLSATEGLPIVISSSKAEIIGKDKNGNFKHAADLTSPKQPVFTVRRMYRQNSQKEVENYTENHESIVEYLSKTWNNVKKELEKKSQREDGPMYYREKDSNPHLQGFNTFDLDSWMSGRILDKLMKSNS